jgi:hypothetical protein
MYVLPHMAHSIFLVVFGVLVCFGFELRALHLQDMCSITSATPPALFAQVIW